MATKPISLRVAEEVKVDLEQIARRFGTSPATLGADYVTQGVRATKHPSIEFRQTPAGRMAYIRGVRLPVWLAIETVNDRELAGSYQKDLSQDETIRKLVRENAELKLYLAALMRLLIKKGAISKEELEAVVTAVDAEDGTVDGGFTGKVS